MSTDVSINTVDSQLCALNIQMDNQNRNTYMQAFLCIVQGDTRAEHM